MDNLTDNLSSDEISFGLDNALRDTRIIIKEVTVSTNTDAKALAVDGFLHPTVIAADCQSGGRGRLGRSFASLSGSGIYMSILFRPDAARSDMLTMYTVVAAVAVMRGIDAQCGVSTQVKWVNDIFLGGKKVCGILTEAVTSGDGGAIASIVVGIGINFCGSVSDIPDEIKGTAGYIFENSPRKTSRNKLISQIVNEFFRVVLSFPDDSFMDAYISRSMLIGHRVMVYPIAAFDDAGNTDGLPPAEPATVKAVTRDGGLQVEYEDGTGEVLRTGEVSVRQM